MPFASVNGCELRYEVRGEGPPLLLIPGRGLDRTSWAPQIGCYAAHFRTIAYDPRGAGETRGGNGDFGVVDMARDAEALLEALGCRQAHIAGFSLGGMAAIHVAAGGRIEPLSLSLHSTVHRAYAHLRWRQRLSLRILEIDDAELWALFSAYTAFGAEFINAHEDVVQAEVERRADRWKAMSAEQKSGVAAQIRAAMTHDAPDLLSRIDAPTLVTVGTSDEATRPEYARDLASRIRGAKLVTFPGAPHRVSAFATDEFNRVTLDFLLAHAQPVREGVRA